MAPSLIWCHDHPHFLYFLRYRWSELLFLLPGRFLTPHQTCLSQCPTGTFGNKTSGQCEGCSAGCVTCQEAKACQGCREGLYLQEDVCVKECQRCFCCYLSSWFAQTVLCSDRQTPLSASFPEGFLKVRFAARVPLSVHPVRKVPPSVWVVRSLFCCWIAPVCPPVQRASIRTSQNAIAVQITAASAARTACVRVSALRGDVRRIKDVSWNGISVSSESAEEMRETKKGEI